MRGSHVGLDEDGRQWRRARTRPVAASENLSEDILLTTFLHCWSLEGNVVAPWKERAANACYRRRQNVSRARRALNRAEGSRSRKRRCGRVVPVAVGVQRPQSVRCLLQKDGGLVMLSTRRCRRSEHCLGDILRDLRMVVHRRGTSWVWLLIHLLVGVVRHHVFWARRYHSHW